MCVKHSLDFQNKNNACCSIIIGVLPLEMGHFIFSHSFWVILKIYSTFNFYFWLEMTFAFEIHGKYNRKLSYNRKLMVSEQLSERHKE